jgi:NADH dehydrogenase FAD-containing subunit
MRNAQRSMGVVGGGFTGVAAAIACLERLQVTCESG